MKPRDKKILEAAIVIALGLWIIWGISKKWDFLLNLKPNRGLFIQSR